MNTENIIKVADAIEQHSIPDLGFNMRALIDEADSINVPNHFEEPCGTVACIAGWAYVLAGGSVKTRDPVKVWETATDWIGFETGGEARDLFAPHEHLGRFTRLTPTQAVAVLRHLAATGEVDWSIGAPEATNA